eukprot:360680-Chlamydomonas_euryale.AAC.1
MLGRAAGLCCQQRFTNASSCGASGSGGSQVSGAGISRRSPLVTFWMTCHSLKLCAGAPFAGRSRHGMRSVMISHKMTPNANTSVGKPYCWWPSSSGDCHAGLLVSPVLLLSRCSGGTTRDRLKSHSLATHVPGMRPRSRSTLYDVKSRCTTPLWCMNSRPAAHP